MTNPTPKADRQYSKARPKVPPFARYQGTSAWRKDRRRARAYAMYLAATKPAAAAAS
jgi:hypothetical protein